MNFLKAVHNALGSSAENTVSMYQVGQSLGFEKEDAKRAAEELIAEGMIEVRTLSGDIGITEEGLAALGQEDSPKKNAKGVSRGLPDVPVLDPEGTEKVKEVLMVLKKGFPSLLLEYPLAEELVFDVKTIEVQLFSPRPKTAVIRETLLSVYSQLEEIAEKNETQEKTKSMLASFLRI